VWGAEVANGLGRLWPAEVCQASCLTSAPPLPCPLPLPLPPRPCLCSTSAHGVFNTNGGWLPVLETQRCPMVGVPTWWLLATVVHLCFLRGVVLSATMAPLVASFIPKLSHGCRPLVCDLHFGQQKGFLLPVDLTVKIQLLVASSM
jgi:hypothetical protein